MYVFVFLCVVIALTGSGTHTWNKFLQPQEVAHMVRKHGMELEEVAGLRYNPLKNTWQLDRDDIDVNYLLHARKRGG